MAWRFAVRASGGAAGVGRDGRILEHVQHKEPVPARYRYHDSSCCLLFIANCRGPCGAGARRGCCWQLAQGPIARKAVLGKEQGWPPVLVAACAQVPRR